MGAGKAARRMGWRGAINSTVYKYSTVCNTSYILSAAGKSASFSVFLNQAGTPLCDHDGGRIGVTARDGRHDGGIHHPQAANAVHLKPGVRDCARIVRHAHAAGTHRMEDRGADIAGSLCQLLVCLHLRTRHELLGPVACQGWLAGDLACKAQASHRDPAVFLMGQVIGRNCRRGMRVGGTYPHGSARMRAQIAYACREGGEAMQRIAELVERQGLDMELQVRG